MLLASYNLPDTRRIYQHLMNVVKIDVETGHHTNTRSTYVAM